LDLITPDVEALLLPFIKNKCVELGYHLYALNCMPDHLHILLGLSPTMRVTDVAKNLKGASSHYINNLTGLGVALYWQKGYGVFTLHESKIPTVARYIQNQKEHHAQAKVIYEYERTQA
jgi:putative transposase